MLAQGPGFAFILIDWEPLFVKLFVSIQLWPPVLAWCHPSLLAPQLWQSVQGHFQVGQIWLSYLHASLA